MLLRCTNNINSSDSCLSRLYQAVVLGSGFLGCLVDLCAQLLDDIAQALGVDVLSMLRESGIL